MITKSSLNTSFANISVLKEPVLASVSINSRSNPTSLPKISKFSSLANQGVKFRASSYQIFLKSVILVSFPNLTI